LITIEYREGKEKNCHQSEGINDRAGTAASVVGRQPRRKGLQVAAGSENAGQVSQHWGGRGKWPLTLFCEEKRLRRSGKEEALREKAAVKM